MRVRNAEGHKTMASPPTAPYTARPNAPPKCSPNLLVALACLQCLAAGAILFGWNALETVLRADGVFANLCGETGNGGAVGGCSAQSVRLALLYTVGVGVQTAFSFPAGAVLDRFGPRRTSATAAVMFGLGCMFLSLASAGTSKPLLFFPAVICFAISASGLIFSVIHISSLFVERGRSKLVVALINGFVDASAAVFMLFEQLHRRGYSLSSVSAIYGALTTAALLAIAAFAWPDKAYEAPAGATPTERPNEATLIDDIDDKPRQARSKTPAATLAQSETGTTANSSCLGGVLQLDKARLSAMPFVAQVRTRAFIFQLAFFCVHLLKFSWYLSTLIKQLENMGQNEEDPAYTRMFSVILPCGFLLNPAVGWLLDRLPLWASFAFTNCASLLFSAISSSMVLSVQPVAFVAFVLFRSSFFSVSTAFLVECFGVRTFGKTWGLTVTIASIVASLQLLLIYLTYEYENGRFNVFNYILTALNIPAFLFPLALYRAERERTRSRQCQHRECALPPKADTPQVIAQNAVAIAAESASIKC